MVGLLLGVATALIAAVVALFLAAVLVAPRDMDKAELARVYPDIVRLLWRLSRDGRVARRVRWRLLVAVAYNAQPINLIPDFIPVIGLLDNIVVTAWAVRSAIRTSASQVIADNWPGSDRGLTFAYALCRLKPTGSIGDRSGPERRPVHQGTPAGCPRRASS